MAFGMTFKPRASVIATCCQLANLAYVAQLAHTLSKPPCFDIGRFFAQIAWVRKGGKRLKCSWCLKYGVCSWDRAGGVENLWDVDDVGLLCDICSILEKPFRWPNSGQYCAVWLVGNRIFPRVSDTPGMGKFMADHLAKKFQSEASTDKEKHLSKQGTHVLRVDS